MNLKQAKENGNKAYCRWLAFGMPESYNELNDSNREIIKAYISEFPDAMGYKFHVGFVEIKDKENLYNFCCDYIFDGIFGNMAKVQEMHQKYMKSGKLADLEELDKVLEEANGICLLWC